MTTTYFDPIGRPSSSVREIETQDGAALLDIKRGVCLSLTPVAATIWRLLKDGQSPEQISDYIAITFKAPRHEVATDLKDFLKDLTQRELLTTNDRTKPISTWLIAVLHRCHTALQKRLQGSDRMPVLVGKALVALLIFDLLRLSTHFSIVYQCVLGWTVTPHTARTGTLDRVSKAIDYACVWYPKTVLCLQRSAVMTCMLRSCGITACMVLGAQKVPFAAHAWCEAGGHPVGERRDVTSLYFVWDRC